MHPVEKIDLSKLLLIIVGWLGVRSLNIGTVSGYVRQETLVKLKILFTLLEVPLHAAFSRAALGTCLLAVQLLDKLMGTYGNHILGSLFWALEARPEAVKRGIAWHFLISMGYIGWLPTRRMSARRSTDARFSLSLSCPHSPLLRL